MLQCEGSSHLRDFAQQYIKFNSQQAGAQSSEEGIAGLDQQYLVFIHLADSVFSLSGTTIPGPTFFANHSTVQLSLGNGEMLLQH